MKSIIQNVAKHSFIYGLGEILNKGIAFMLIPLYTHYLAPKEYGILELLDLTSYLVGIFVSIGVNSAVIRFYHEHKDPVRKNLVLSSGLIMLWILCAAWLLILVPLTPYVSTLVFQAPEYSRLFNIMFLTMVVTLSCEIPLSYLRIQQKSILFTGISTLKLLVTLSLNVLFIVHYRMGPMGILIAGAIANGMVALMVTPYLLKHTGLRFSFKIAAPMLSFGVPLLGNALGMFLIYFSDRFILQKFAGLTDVGIYSLASKFGMIPNVFILAPFMNVWGPKQFEYSREPDGKQIISTVFTYYCFVLVYFVLCLAAIVPDIIRVMADSQYHDAGRYAAPIILGNAFICTISFSQFGLLQAKKTHILAISTLITAALAILLRLSLIPAFGLWGATISTLATYFLLLSFVTFFAQRQYPVPYRYGRILWLLAVAGCLYAAAAMLSLPNPWFTLAARLAIALSFPLVLFLTGFYTRDEIAIFRQAPDYLRSYLGRFLHGDAKAGAP